MKQTLILLSGILGSIAVNGDMVDEDCGYGITSGFAHGLNSCSGSMYNNSGFSSAYVCSDDGMNVTFYYFDDTAFCNNTPSWYYDATNEFTYFQCPAGDENSCVVASISASGDVWDAFNGSQVLSDYYSYTYDSTDCDYRYVNLSNYNVSIDPGCYNYSDWYYSYVNWTYVYVYNGSSDCEESYDYYFYGWGWSLKDGYYYEEYNCSNTTYESSGGECIADEILSNEDFASVEDLWYFSYAAIVIGQCDGWSMYGCDDNGGLILYYFDGQNCTGNVSDASNQTDSCYYNSGYVGIEWYGSCNYTYMPTYTTTMGMYPTTTDNMTDADGGSGGSSSNDAGMMNTTMENGTDASGGSTGNETGMMNTTMDNDPDTSDDTNTVISSANMDGARSMSVVMMFVAVVYATLS